MGEAMGERGEPVVAPVQFTLEFSKRRNINIIRLHFSFGFGS